MVTLKVQVIQINMVKQNSEFGKGLTYCLGLFLCHSERDYLITENDKEKMIINKPHMWFYGASDHLFDLQIPKTLPKVLQKRLKEFQRKCLIWRLPMMQEDKATEEDRIWAVDEAKELLRAVDRYYGIKTIKGDWT